MCKLQLYMPKRFLRHFRFRDGFQYLDITEIWYSELFSNRKEKREREKKKR